MLAAAFGAGMLVTYVFLRRENRDRPPMRNEEPTTAVTDIEEIKEQETVASRTDKTTSTSQALCTPKQQRCGDSQFKSVLKSASPSLRNLHRYKPTRYAKKQSAKDKSVFANLGVVGVGSFCTVFKVQRTSDFRIFALKQSSEQLNTKDAVNTALNEVRVMKALQYDELHAHVAHFRAHWISRFHSNKPKSNKSNSAPGPYQLNQLYEFYAHGTLLDMARRKEPMNARQIAQCLAQLLDGVAFVHAQRILHLDLKPSNIFIDSAFCLKIGDFGISIDLSAAETNKSTKIEFSGDPIYIAPECLGFGRSLSNVGFAADIFALGVMALEMLFHINVPSRGPLFEALRNFVDFDTFEALPHFRSLLSLRMSDYRCADGNDALRAIIAQMLHREAKDRPTATESLERVQRLLRDREFVRGLSGLDAIELDLIMSDTESIGAATPPTTPLTARTPTKRRSLTPSDLPMRRRSPENTAPSEFVETSAKTFHDMTLNLSPTRRMPKKSMKRDREAIKITPTKSPPTKRSLFMSPQRETPRTTSIKSTLSPFDSLKKVRCRETQIGHFSEGGRSRKKPRRSRNMVCKDSPSQSPSISATSTNLGSDGSSPMVSASLSEDGQGMSSLWDDDVEREGMSSLWDDDVKREENVSQSPTRKRRLSFSSSDTKKGRAAALNSPNSPTECVGDEKKEEDSPNRQSPLRLSFRSPSFSSADTKKTRSIRGRAAALNSPTDTECVRKHLFFGDAEDDEKDGESESEDESEAGSQLEFLFG